MPIPNSPPRTVYEYFRAALNHRRQTGPGMRMGRAEKPEERLQVVFFAAVEEGSIARLEYQASTCATLLAYCELLRRLATGTVPGAVLAMRPWDLASRLHGVPVRKQDRAGLALAALKSALGGRNEKAEELTE